MTGGEVHVTDYSNAARTMLFNIHTLDWDDEILALLDIPKCMLPKPVECSGHYGETISELFGGPIPITGSAGDQQAALFGETCFEVGEAKCTYGTGSFLLLNTGDRPVFSDSGLLTTIAWGLDGKVSYALEGSAFVCGAAIQWLRDEMQFMSESPESERMALKAGAGEGVYMVAGPLRESVLRTGSRMLGGRFSESPGARIGTRLSVRRWNPWHIRTRICCLPWQRIWDSASWPLKSTAVPAGTIS